MALQHYRAIAAVGVNPGSVMRLSKDQAAARVHAIEAQGKPDSGMYLVKARVEFKAGETFHLDGDLPKAMAELAEPAGRRKAGGPDGAGSAASTANTPGTPGTSGTPGGASATPVATGTAGAGNADAGAGGLGPAGAGSALLPDAGPAVTTSPT